MSSLEHFVSAQTAVWSDVLAELAAGRKQSHWMWFVFPQHRALGRSAMARTYGIASLEEARDYLAHPVLGERLRQCTERVLAVQGRTAHQIFGTPDDLKLRSCMTLFSAAASGPQRSLFDAVLARHYGGVPDAQTLALLA